MATMFRPMNALYSSIWPVVVAPFSLILAVLAPLHVGARLSSALRSQGEAQMQPSGGKGAGVYSAITQLKQSIYLKMVEWPLTCTRRSCHRTYAEASPRVICIYVS